jgi:lipopolysaccharide heptosyltransferase II
MRNEWSQAKNILCIRLDYMGDVLMCTPAMRAIRESAPGRSITLLTSDSGAAVSRFIPEIDDVITYAPPWMKSSPVRDANYQFEMVKTLQQRAFDAAVIFTTYTQSPLPAAFLCLLAGIPLRLAHCRENPYQLLTYWVADPDSDPEKGVRHEVQRQLDLVESIGCQTDNERLSFTVRGEDLAWMQKRLHDLGIGPHRPWALLHPGATASSRRYPAEHWTRVIALLNAELGMDVLLTGDASEVALINTIIRTCGVTAPAVQSLAGQLDLGQLGAAIALAPVMVSNNTGPAHIAAAVGTPIADLYALTNPQHTPWQVESRVLFHDVPCRFCYKSICPEGHNDCLKKVAPEDVVDAVKSLFVGAGNTLRAQPRPLYSA